MVVVSLAMVPASVGRTARVPHGARTDEVGGMQMLGLTVELKYTMGE